MTTLEGEMTTIKSDMKSEMTTIKSDMKSEMTTIKDVKSEMTTIKSDISKIMTVFNERLSATRQASKINADDLASALEVMKLKGGAS